MKSPTSLIEKELYNLGKCLLANFVYETTPYFITKDGKILEQGCKWKTEEAETTHKRIQERIKEINTQVWLVSARRKLAMKYGGEECCNE